MDIKQKVLLIGWDAADWKIMSQMMDDGLLPNFQKYINNGVVGKIKTLDPPFSPMLWTSIATGMRADKHGILGFVEPSNDLKGIQPVSSTSRKVKSIWNILQQEGYKCHTVGWWPSFPAEPINGICVSDDFIKVQAKSKPGKWIAKEQAIHPKHLKSRFEEMMISIDEITTDIMRPFVPEFDRIDFATDNDLTALAKTICETTNVNTATNWILKNEEWDFMATYFVGIDHACHQFMKYHPPAIAENEEKVRLYSNVVRAMYKYHDMCLGTILSNVPEDTLVVFTSDHGFHSDNLRPVELPNEPAAPALEHNPYGVFAMSGPNIKKDDLVFGASLLDIVPTILQAIGLPIGEDMEGVPLRHVFNQPKPANYVESWEKIQGDTGQFDESFQVDPYDNLEQLNNLVELGYVDKPSDNDAENNARAVFESNYNLGRVFLDAGRFEEAAETFESLITNDESRNRILNYLVYANQQAGNFDKARNYLHELKALTREGGYILLESVLEFHAGNFDLSLQLLDNSNAGLSNNAEALTMRGHALLQTKKIKEAIPVFNEAIKINDNLTEAYIGRGAAHLALSNFESGLDSLLTAVGLDYTHTKAHFYIHKCFEGLEKFDEAEAALRVCQQLEPNDKRVENNLVYIDGMLGRAPKQKERTESPVIIVSGFPRSGTSMMMGMLEAGGIPLFVDGVRNSDEHNENGYFEHEAVKGILDNKSFLSECPGKAVKIVAPLLRSLGNDQHFKIIFMVRDKKQILASQSKMLGKTTHNPVQFNKLDNQLIKIKSYLNRKSNVEVIYVNYNDALETPKLFSESINLFLNEELNIQKMIHSAKPELNHHSSKNKQ